MIVSRDDEVATVIARRNEISNENASEIDVGGVVEDSVRQPYK